jgi:hypothetical protein
LKDQLRPRPRGYMKLFESLTHPDEHHNHKRLK